MTRLRFLQIAFTCLVLFASMFVLAGILDSTGLRLASIPLLFTAGFSYEIWLWWNDRIFPAIFLGLLLTVITAGFVAQLLS